MEASPHAWPSCAWGGPDLTPDLIDSDPLLDSDLRDFDHRFDLLDLTLGLHGRLHDHLGRHGHLGRLCRTFSPELLPAPTASGTAVQGLLNPLT